MQWWGTQMQGFQHAVQACYQLSYIYWLFATSLYGSKGEKSTVLDPYRKAESFFRLYMRIRRASPQVSNSWRWVLCTSSWNVCTNLMASDTIIIPIFQIYKPLRFRYFPHHPASRRQHQDLNLCLSDCTSLNLNHHTTVSRKETECMLNLVA